MGGGTRDVGTAAPGGRAPTTTVGGLHASRGPRRRRTRPLLPPATPQGPPPTVRGSDSGVHRNHRGAGEVLAIENLPDAARYTLRGPVVTEDAVHGASIAVNGVCLTVTDETGSAALKSGEFTADVMAESLTRSSLGDLRPGDRVNLERPWSRTAASAGTSCRATSTAPARSSSAPAASTGSWCASRCPPTWPVTSWRRAPSRSTASASPSRRHRRRRADFTVSLIPATLAQTTLGVKQPGARVNLEVDVIAKYTEKLLGAARAEAAS